MSILILILVGYAGFVCGFFLVGPKVAAVVRRRRLERHHRRLVEELIADVQREAAKR